MVVHLKKVQPGTYEATSHEPLEHLNTLHIQGQLHFMHNDIDAMDKHRCKTSRNESKNPWGR